MRAQGAMYKAVAQSVPLYGRESWVATRDILKVLTAFHHRAAQQITGMTVKRRTGGEWEYSEVDEAMEAVGIHSIGFSIKRMQKTIAERVACQSAYALCTEA